MLFNGSTNEFIRLEEITARNCHFLKEQIESALTMVWFTSDGSTVTIDGVDMDFKKDQILYLTEFHKIEVKTISSARMVRFNRPFYCILDHDSEVGCKGVLFFGASQLPRIDIPSGEVRKFENLWNAFMMEMESVDELQLDMLQMMLKRFLILSTRIFKELNHYDFDNSNLDIVREYNFLVEKHFRDKHSVAEYADLLNRSPKTISNLFKKLGPKTPLQYIHDRIMLEARRLLHYTDKSIKEVAYDLGFDDLQSFSRFFKKQEGKSPKEFKEVSKSGNIVNS